MNALLDRPCWIFDLDGTLTMAVHDFAALRARLGLSGAATVLEAIAAAPAARRADMHAEVERWEREALAGARAAPDAVRLLAALRARGRRLGILTRNLCSIAHDTLAACGLTDYFDPADVLGRDSAPPKPSPAGVLRLLAGWGAAPTAGVMVGDFELDLEAGRRAGVYTVHIARGGDTRAWPGLTDRRVTALDRLLASEATPVSLGW